MSHSMVAFAADLGHCSCALHTIYTSVLCPLFRSCNAIVPCMSFFNTGMTVSKLNLIFHCLLGASLDGFSLIPKPLEKEECVKMQRSESFTTEMCPPRTVMIAAVKLNESSAFFLKSIETKDSDDWYGIWPVPLTLALTQFITNLLGNEMCFAELLGETRNWNITP